MSKELEMLSILGFKNKWIVNRNNGMSVYIPEDLHSNDWCLKIPNGLEFDGVKQDFVMYELSFHRLIDILVNHSSDEKVKLLNEYLAKNHSNIPICNNNSIKNKTKNKTKNCLFIYKVKKNLTFKEMGDIAGITKQRAEQICKANIRDLTIEPFARNESMNVEEFKKTYCELL